LQRVRLISDLVGKWLTHRTGPLGHCRRDYPSLTHKPWWDQLCSMRS